MNSASNGMLFGLIIVVGLFAVTFLYLSVKKTLKRNVFCKKQYEEQKRLVGKEYVYRTGAPRYILKAMVKNAIPVNNSFSAKVKGGNYRILSETEGNITYQHMSKLTVGGDGDEFTAWISFFDTPNGCSVAACIERWREKDGVTRKAGLEAMREFYGYVENAVRAACTGRYWG